METPGSLVYIALPSHAVISVTQDDRGRAVVMVRSEAPAQPMAPFDDEDEANAHAPNGEPE